MDFFKGTDGRYYPVRDIVYIDKVREVTTPHGKSKIHRIKMDKAQEAEIWSYDLSEIITDRSRVITALAGTYALHFDHEDDEGDGLTKSTVIGWRISTDGSIAEPVTADGVNDGMDLTPPVLMPDGTVVSASAAQWPDVTSWQNEMIAHAEAQRGARATRAAAEPVAQS